MVLQRAYDVAIDSDVDLGVPSATPPADVVIRQRQRPVAGWRVSWLDRDSDPWLCVGTIANRYYLRFGDEAEFVVSRNGREIGWHLLDGAADETLVHLLLDHVVPRALSRLGRIVLHGSCVAGSSGCVALLGESGSGKSTLAATLSVRGWRTLADDCVVLGEDRDVAAAYPGHRLTERSVRLSGAGVLGQGAPVSRYTDKRRIPPAGTYSEASSPLLAVIVLSPSKFPAAGPTVIGGLRTPSAAAGIEILKHSFHLTVPAERTHLLAAVLSLAERLPVLRLNNHHDRAGLDRSVIAIENIARSVGIRSGTVARRPPVVTTPVPQAT